MKIQKIIICCVTILLFCPILNLQAAEFNGNYIINNQDQDDYLSMTLQEIQNFLESKNSALADFVVNDINGIAKPASQIIYEAAHNYQVNPKWILVMLQKEQSLVEDPNPTAKQYDWAMGYGVCDDCSLTDPAVILFRGFGTQIDKATARLRWYSQNTNAYKQAGQDYIIDGHLITPVNQATANLYSYTPHIHGNYLFWKIWQRWFKQYYPDGSLVRTLTGQTVYLLDYGFKKPIESWSALISRYDPNKIITISQQELDKYELGSTIKFPNYSLLHQPDGKIFLLVDNNLRHIDSMETFRTIGFSLHELIEVDSQDLINYPQTEPITIKSSYPVGALLQDNETGGVYFVQNGIKHPLIAKEIMQINYPHYPITSVSPDELNKYDNGQTIKFREGELLKSPDSPVVYVIASGKKCPIQDEATFNNLNYDWNKIHTVSEKSLSNLSPGPYVDLNFKE